jgi:hypothetical protein
MAIRKPRPAAEPGRPVRTEQEINALIAEIGALRQEILDRRHGVPIDVDAILDEMRGYKD